MCSVLLRKQKQLGDAVQVGQTWERLGGGGLRALGGDGGCPEEIQGGKGAVGGNSVEGTWGGGRCAT